MSHKQVSFRKKFCQRKKFLYTKKFNHRKKFLVEFPSEKHSSATEKKVLVTEKVSVTERKKKLPQTKVFVREKMLPSQKQVDKNLIYQDIMLSSPKGKC